MSLYTEPCYKISQLDYTLCRQWL